MSIAAYPVYNPDSYCCKCGSQVKKPAYQARVPIGEQHLLGMLLVKCCQCGYETVRRPLDSK